jgi:hypothetical protein
MNKINSIVIFTLLLLLLTACNMPTPTSSAAEQTALIDTSVAKTVLAREKTTSQPSQPPLVATDTPQSQPEDTPSPTDTPIPDTATPTETPIPCNLARFVSDVTIPDGTEFAPGKSFTKTWSLKNIGSCPWTSGYDIIFFGGDAMGAPSSVQITTGIVDTGQNVHVSVNLTAPSLPGTYRGNWQLRDPSDVIFGIENSTSGSFWVEIVVPEPTPTATLDPQL